MLFVNLLRVVQIIAILLSAALLNASAPKLTRVKFFQSIFIAVIVIIVDTRNFFDSVLKTIFSCERLLNASKTNLLL